MYPEGFSYRYTSIGAEILVSKKRYIYIYLFTLIFFHRLCFFFLTLIKFSLQVSKYNLSIINHSRIEKHVASRDFNLTDDHHHFIRQSYLVRYSLPKKICCVGNGIPKKPLDTSLGKFVLLLHYFCLLNFQYKLNSHKSFFIVTVNLCSSTALLIFSLLQFHCFFS